MSKKHSQKQYLSSGHSLDAINMRVKILQSTKVINLSLARFEIATELGYKNWKILIKDIQNDSVNRYFSYGFSNKAKHKYLYNIFLEAKKLEDTMENHRFYLASNVVKQKELEDPDSKVSLNKEIKIESLTKEILTRMPD